MRKIVCLLITVLMLTVSAVCSAGEVGPKIPTSTKISEAYTSIWKGIAGKNTKVGVVYKNDAKTTFDDDIDYSIINAVVEAINPQSHIMVDSTVMLDEMQKMGINNVTYAERADIIDIAKKQDLDYAVIVQVDPFLRKERMSMLRYTIEMTSNIVLKIVDVNGNRYIYNGKISEFAKHGTAVGGISNKATVEKVLEKAAPQIRRIVSTIPKG